MQDELTFPIDFNQSLQHSELFEESTNDSTIEFKLQSKQIGTPTGNDSAVKAANDLSTEKNLNRVTTIREQDDLIRELKKECFGLKMRIFYMEERLHDTFDTSTGDIIKKNVELKVRIEELKQENNIKSELLAKASFAMDQLTAAKMQDEKTESTKSTLEKKTKEIEKLRKDCAVTKEKLIATQNQLQERDNKVEKLQKALDDISDGFEALKAKKRDDEEVLKSMVKELEETIADKENIIDDLKLKMAAIEKDKNVLEMTLSEKEIEKEKCIKMFQEQIVQLHASLEGKNKEKKLLELEVSSNEKTIKDELYQMNERTTHDLNKMNSILEAKDKDLKIANKQIQINEEEIKVLHLQLDTKNKDFMLLHNSKLELEFLLDENKRKLAEEQKKGEERFAEEIAKLKVKKTKTDLSRHLKITELESLCQKLDKEKVQLELNYQKKKKELEDFQELSNKQKNQLELKWENKLKQEQDLQKNLQECIKELTEKINARDQEILNFKELQEADAEKKNYLNGLNQHFVTAKDQLKKVNKQLVEMKKKYENTEENLKGKLKEKEILLGEMQRRKPVRKLSGSLIEKLESLFNITEEEKQKYMQLNLKLLNNQHPDSQLNLLEHELSEVEFMRKKLLDHFRALLHEYPLNDNHQETEYLQSFEESDSLNGLVQLTPTQASQREQILEAILLNKENELDEKKNMINILENEKSNLLCELGKLKELTENSGLINLKENFEKSQALIIELKNQLTTDQANSLDEKEHLKNDVRELCNINKRLRKKIKDVSQKHQQLMHENLALLEVQSKSEQQIQIVNEKISSELSLNKKLENELDIMKNNFHICSEQLHSYENLNRRMQQQLEDQKKAYEIQLKVLTTELSQLQSNMKIMDESAQLKGPAVLSFEFVINELKAKISASNREIDCLSKELEKKSCLLSDNSLEKLNATITTLNSHINSLKAELLKASAEHHEFLHLQEEIKTLKESKLALEKHKVEPINEHVLINEKDAMLKNVSSQQLEELINSFSPVHTSSKENLLPSDGFSQTENSVLLPIDNTIALHIEEMQKLQKQLEAAIQNNDALRQKFEDRLSLVEKEAISLNDPQLRVSLVRENDGMRARIYELDQLCKQMKAEVNGLQIELNHSKNENKRLHAQIHDLNELTFTLKSEMQVYDCLVQKAGFDKFNRTADLEKELMIVLLEEIRDLREQLKLIVTVNNQLRVKLEEKLGKPLSNSSFDEIESSARRALFSGKSSMIYNKLDQEFASVNETPTKDDISLQLPKCNQNNIISDVEFNHQNLLKKLINNLLTLSVNIEIKLTALDEKTKLTADEKTASEIRKDIIEIKVTLKEIVQIMHVSKKSNQNGSTEIMSLKSELRKLKKILSSKEKFIARTLDMIENNILWKESMNQSLMKKLIKARDTLKATKGNLQIKTTSRDQYSSSLPSPLTENNLF